MPRLRMGNGCSVETVPCAGTDHLFHRLCVDTCLSARLNRLIPERTPAPPAARATRPRTTPADRAIPPPGSPPGCRPALATPPRQAAWRPPRNHVQRCCRCNAIASNNPLTVSRFDAERRSSVSCQCRRLLPSSSRVFLALAVSVPILPGTASSLFAPAPSTGFHP